MKSNGKVKAWNEPFYFVSLRNFVALTVVTAGLYQLCWWFKNFQVLIEKFNYKRNSALPPRAMAALMTLLVPVTCSILLVDLEFTCQNQRLKLPFSGAAAGALVGMGAAFIGLLIFDYFNVINIGWFGRDFFLFLVVLCFISFLVFYSYAGKLKGSLLNSQKSH